MIPTPNDIESMSYYETLTYAADYLGIPLSAIEYVATMDDGIYVVER